MAVLENDVLVGPVTPAAGVTTISLDFDGTGWEASWLEVYKSGSETPLVLGTDYTVADAGTVSAVVTLATPANGTDAYSVYLATPLERSSDMQLRGEFKSEPFNVEMDRLWQRLQFHWTHITRTLRLSATSIANGVLSSVSAGQHLAMKPDGTGFEGVDFDVSAGQYVRKKAGGVGFEGVTPDFELVVSEVDAWFQNRDFSAAQQAALLTNGSIAVLNGRAYKVDSSATGSASATNDLGVNGLVPYGIPTPYHYGGVGDGVADDTLALQSFFDRCPDANIGDTFDFTGIWGVTDEINIDVGGVIPLNFVCGSIHYIGSSDLDLLVYLKDVRFAKFTGIFTAIGGGSVTYSTRTVTDLIIGTLTGGATFDGFFGRYAKRHGLDLGGKIGDTPSHIGIDTGRSYFKECGSPVYNIAGANVRLKQYDFTGRVDSGSGTSVNQRTTLTIAGGVDVLQEGGILKFNDHYHWIDSVDAIAGTIEVFPWLTNTDTSGTFDSSHGAAIRNWGANSASMRIRGLKALGCGVGLDNECLYGPHVSNLETQVVGVSYKQKGLCRGTVIDVFHPETPDGDVDILKCDGFASDTTVSGLSVYRPQDIKQLVPVDASGNETVGPMIGVCINPETVPAFAGEKTHPERRVTSMTLKNGPDTGFVVARNRTATTISLERDLEIARLFGYTTVKIMRIGDSANLTPGSTTIEPTTAEAADGVTVMGAATYTLPALPEGTVILCDLDVSRNDWRVYVPASLTPQAAPSDPSGGATVDAEARTAIESIIDKLQSAGVFT